LDTDMTDEFPQATFARRAFLPHRRVGLGSIALSSLLARAETRGAGRRPRQQIRPRSNSARRPPSASSDLRGRRCRSTISSTKSRCSTSAAAGVAQSVRKGFSPRITGVTRCRGRCRSSAPASKFKPFGKSGLRMSELFREMGAFADDMCLVKSMQTTTLCATKRRCRFLVTGSQPTRRPSWGSWVSYALGSENRTCRNSWSCSPASATAGRRRTRDVAQRLPARPPPGLPVSAAVKEPVFFVPNPPGIDDKARKSASSTA